MKHTLNYFGGSYQDKSLPFYFGSSNAGRGLLPEYISVELFLALFQEFLVRASGHLPKIVYRITLVIISPGAEG